jgi:predicted small integral membrane protein
MTLRIAKTALVIGVALYTTLIVFNNLVDYGSNYEFVRHVLMMDSSFPNNHGMWRAINSPAWHSAFYWLIIVGEAASMVLCWCGGIGLAVSLAKDPVQFKRAKDIAVAGLTLNLMIWLAAFLVVGGEWFLMWQSKTWNGQMAAWRMFTIVGIVLLLLVQPDDEREKG